MPIVPRLVRSIFLSLENVSAPAVRRRMAQGVGRLPPPRPPNQLPSEIVEFTKDGQFIGQLSIDSIPGAAFGIAIVPVPVSANTARIALVNDDDNTIIVQTVDTGG